MNKKPCRRVNISRNSCSISTLDIINRRDSVFWNRQLRYITMIITSFRVCISGNAKLRTHIAVGVDCIFSSTYLSVLFLLFISHSLSILKEPVPMRARSAGVFTANIRVNYYEIPPRQRRPCCPINLIFPSSPVNST